MRERDLAVEGGLMDERELSQEELEYGLDEPDVLGLSGLGYDEQPLEGTGWRVAKSLVVLRNQINAMAPNRRKGADGTIGDAAHAASASRHNPNAAGVVTALDITHDPANGCDIHKIADVIRRHPHRDLAYLISNRRIASRPGWAWRAYGGSAPHSEHVHFGVGTGPDRNPVQPYDDEIPWTLKDGTPTPPPPPVPGTKKRTLRLSHPLMSGADVAWVQRQLNAIKLPVGVDGYYGPETVRAIVKFQRLKKLDPDGVIGPLTWRALEVS